MEKIRREARRNRVWHTVLPILLLLPTLAWTMTVGMYHNRATLNRMFGRGERRLVQQEMGDMMESIYYPPAYPSQEATWEGAAELAQTLSGEGIVLLKNDGLLPLSHQQPITPLGLGFLVPIYGGTGSSFLGNSPDRAISPLQGLAQAFDQVHMDWAEEMKEWGGVEHFQDAQVAASRPLTSEHPGHVLYELAPEVYQPWALQMQDTVAIVLLGRQTGENLDAHTGGYQDGTPHMLALTAGERALLSFAKENCQKVVVVLASSSPMEVGELEADPQIQAILWMGGAGVRGYGALGALLTGETTPSGRLPTLWESNFLQGPTFPNQDNGTEDFLYTNGETTLVQGGGMVPGPVPFREYEEGIYLGYRYYETAYDLGYLTQYHSPEKGVVYPFGHGLSYTTFSQEIQWVEEKEETILVTVRVENTGEDYGGKEVVQLYATPPYTPLDVFYGIEKSTVQLVAYGKTEHLLPGESELIQLTLPRENLASYAHGRPNPDGTRGCYGLEAGTYLLSLRQNAHQVLDTWEIQVDETIWYDQEHPRPSERMAQTPRNRSGAAVHQDQLVVQAAVNRFEELTAYMTQEGVSGATVLSRARWLESQPTGPEDQDRMASDTVLEWIAQSDTTKVPERGEGTPKAPPRTGMDHGLVLADLRGRSYQDPMWNLLLEQLTWDRPDQIHRALFQSGYQTGSLPEIGKPESVEHDGPQGLTFSDLKGQNWIQGVCGYPSAPILAASWNEDLLYQFGFMVGQEALWAGINGWYAPGLNLHRSPFGGRVSEYFSEDPYLAGTLGRAVISGAGDAGLSCGVKHFVLMDTEAHKNPHTCVWLTEQTLRELYLRPFELALKGSTKTIRYRAKEQGAMLSRTMRAGDFVMAADVGVGATWSAANYSLLTQVLRQEWGFQGTVTSDMHLSGTDAQVDWLLQAGCDTLMSTASGTPLHPSSYEDPETQWQLRRAIHNLCYTQVNSNLMQGVAPGSVMRYAPAPWEVGLLVFHLAVAVVEVGLLSYGVWKSWLSH